MAFPWQVYKSVLAVTASLYHNSIVKSIKRYWLGSKIMRIQAQDAEAASVIYPRLCIVSCEV